MPDDPALAKFAVEVTLVALELGRLRPGEGAENHFFFVGRACGLGDAQDQKFFLGDVFKNHEFGIVGDLLGDFAAGVEVVGPAIEVPIPFGVVILEGRPIYRGLVGQYSRNDQSIRTLAEVGELFG